MTNTPPQQSTQQPPVSLWQPLTNRNFRLLAIGEIVSNLGDQFYFVALPWLTLALTGSPLDLGAVLMVVAIPRAILMVLGGALSDRISPKTVMLISNILRAGLTAILATLVATETTQLWHLYALALSFGIIEGFFSPAAEAIVPSLVSEEQLMASNILGQSANQVILLVGPALAGAVIASMGVSIAFAVDAVSFVISTTALFLIHQSGRAAATPSCCAAKSGAGSGSNSLLSDISAGLQYTWQNLPLRTLILSLAIYNFLFIGPLQVGIFTLAQERFANASALALGITISAWGAGGLIGTLLPQWLPQLPKLGVLMLILASIQGLGMVTMSTISNWPLASLVSAILGGCSSFFLLVGTTWIQKKTPPEVLGRVMGVGLLSSVGVAPFSYALAGILANINLWALYGGSGLAMLAVSAILAVSPAIRTLD
ncbi:MAG: MFS transporter [Cyanobacteria bacterium P01_H01_bin.21]